MAEKKEDEIMAEYLLKGGKMLEKGCRTCGCPMFEYKGKAMCVVCAEHEKQAKEQGGRQGRSPAAAARRSPAGTGAAQGSPPVPAPIDTRVLEDELAATICSLCTRVQSEDDPERCLALMHSVKAGIEGLSCLRQL